MAIINYYSSITSSMTQFIVWVCFFSVLSPFSCLGRKHWCLTEKKITAIHIFTHIISAYLWGSCVFAEEMLGCQCCNIWSWESGGDSESVSLLVCMKAEYMVEDMRRTWEENQLEVWKSLYLAKRFFFFACAYFTLDRRIDTCFQRAALSVYRHVPSSAQTSNVPDRQEVSLACVHSS